MPEPVIRVLVVDDQPLFASGIGMLIEAQPDMDCVGTAQTGALAVELVRREHPDIVLMDLRMPGMSGLEATRLVLGDTTGDEPPRVIVLTTIRHDDVVVRAMSAGASAFLTKDATPTEVLDTIRTVQIGDAVTTSALGAAGSAAPAVPSPPREEALAVLSPREREVFLLIARGLSNADIAQASWISEATVKSHARAILQKLSLRSRVQVVIFAYENGLVRP